MKSLTTLAIAAVLANSSGTAHAYLEVFENADGYLQNVSEEDLWTRGNRA